MLCEICGRNVSKTRPVIMDGSEMLACNECAGFGVEKQIPAEAPERIVFRDTKFKEKFDEGLDLQPGFGKRIQQARQKKQLTFEELGKNIFEPASLLRRIESESIKPSDRLIEKLEKELQLKLREK